MTVDMEQSDEEFYLDINKLLYEVCCFLKKASSNFTSKEKAQAQNLIDQCKKQLTVLAQNKCYSAPDYVVMNSDVAPTPPPPLLPKTNKIESKPSETASKNDQTNDYSNSEKVQSSQPSINNEIVCPFHDLPAKNASKDNKYGDITFHKKVFTIFDHSRKIYAVIHDSWLLLYWSKSSSKPSFALHLRYYDAQQDEPDINELEDSRNETFTLNTKKKASFRVFHVLNKEKKFNFTAESSKDRRQWVCSIKKEHSVAVSLDYLGVENDVTQVDLDNGENIYDVVNICHQENVPKKEEKVVGPALPRKPPMLQPPSNRSSASSEMEIYDELVIKNPPLESDVSENEDYCELDQFVVTRRKDAVNEPENINTQPIVANKTETKPETPPPLPKLRKPVVVQKDEEELDEENTYEEFYVTPVTLIPETPKVNINSSVMKITRNTIKSEIFPNNFETFSRNSKIETFQASPSKDPPPTPFQLKTDEVPIIPMESTENNTDQNQSELPMVLLKPTKENEENSNKVKKKKTPSISIQKRQKMLFKQ